MNISDSEAIKSWDPLFLQLAEGHLRLMYLSHMYVGKVLEEHGLHHIHYAMLQVVGGTLPYNKLELPVSVSDIARSIGLTPATNTALIDRLEKMEFLERTPDATDRRVIRVRLLPKGGEVLQSLEDYWNQHAHELFAGISRTDLQVVVQVMDALEHWYVQNMKEKL
ncbi:MarR family winged helix-turn-helix transcriptional regulator [Deinococcus cellulosilyticus]|uniref:HTH marR-type domain-containing protein n=1 Tax=Deinococcus cellulosilyticus (strain DSM 18568 / NBRC 106333 / KACC 11606 / 5516J-15) TaxID=1223518 RepID=A0A511NBU1_DEIC1|nr:MarR family transcriptional regulator [Deinococcus cellulosilyticus]GEM49968.1 hypothetical protein DC3_56030 [Deinococcus cellulosilyticus NBRC 106333 = KACC 11606]